MFSNFITKMAIRTEHLCKRVPETAEIFSPALAKHSVNHRHQSAPQCSIGISNWIHTYKVPSGFAGVSPLIVTQSTHSVYLRVQEKK